MRNLLDITQPPEPCQHHWRSDPDGLAPTCAHCLVVMSSTGRHQWYRAWIPRLARHESVFKS